MQSSWRLAGVIIFAIVAGIASSFGATASPGLGTAVSPAKMPRTATVDPRYQSYNVEMAEVIGGNFMRPCLQTNVDIYLNSG
jgi:hypothetical protein